MKRMKEEARSKRKEGDEQGSGMRNEKGRKVEEKMKEEEIGKSREDG